MRLATLAMFGEAPLGPLLTASADLPDPETVGPRFRDWLGRLLGTRD